MIYVVSVGVEFEGMNVIGAWDDVDRAKKHAENQLSIECGTGDRCSVPTDVEFWVEGFYLNDPDMGSYRWRLVYPWKQWL